MADLEQARVRGEDAKALLNNSLLKAAFAKVGEYLEAKALSVDVSDKERALSVITAKQLLAGIKREIERVIEDGEVAAVRIDQLEKKSMLKRIVR